jgi:hypothetical protein
VDHGGHEAQHGKSRECPESARTKRTAALGSMKGRVRVIRIRIQSKVAVVVKLTLEGIRAVQKAEKEKRCHLSKVR